MGETKKTLTDFIDVESQITFAERANAYKAVLKSLNETEKEHVEKATTDLIESVKAVSSQVMFGETMARELLAKLGCYLSDKEVTNGHKI